MERGMPLERLRMPVGALEGAMVARPYRVYPWMHPAERLAAVKRIALHGLATYLSGRVEPVTLAGVVVVSDLELAMRTPDGVLRPNWLKAAREANVRRSMDEAAAQAERLAAQGWWVRSRRRGKRRARRITGLEWVA